MQLLQNVPSLRSPTEHACYPAAATWVLVDFGLAKFYIDDSGNQVPARPTADFRGSTTYASGEQLPVASQGSHVQAGHTPQQWAEELAASCHHCSLLVRGAVNCMRNEDQSRRDDLWGWFYCLVEMLEGERALVASGTLLHAITTPTQLPVHLLLTAS
jgi:serine/threonine protein kinase